MKNQLIILITTIACYTQAQECPECTGPGVIATYDRTPCGPGCRAVFECNGSLGFIDNFFINTGCTDDGKWALEDNQTCFSCVPRGYSSGLISDLIGRDTRGGSNSGRVTTVFVVVATALVFISAASLLVHYEEILLYPFDKAIPAESESKNFDEIQKSASVSFKPPPSETNWRGHAYTQDETHAESGSANYSMAFDEQSNEDVQPRMDPPRATQLSKLRFLDGTKPPSPSSVSGAHSSHIEHSKSESIQPNPQTCDVDSVSAQLAASSVPKDNSPAPLGMTSGNSVPIVQSSPSSEESEKPAGTSLDQSMVPDSDQPARRSPLMSSAMDDETSDATMQVANIHPQTVMRRDTPPTLTPVHIS